MKNIPAKLIILAILLRAASAIAEPESISLNELIENVSKYDEKVVKTNGVLFLTFEGNIICDTKEEMKNCLYVVLSGTSKDQVKKYGQFNESLVSITGRFKATEPQKCGEPAVNGKLIICVRRNLNVLKEVTGIEHAKK